MDLIPRLHLTSWLAGQGLTGVPENDLLRGFCERCRAGKAGIEQTGIEKIGTFATRLEREFAEAQHAKLNAQIDEFTLIRQRHEPDIIPRDAQRHDTTCL